jgi:hypothetical protein
MPNLVCDLKGAFDGASALAAAEVGGYVPGRGIRILIFWHQKRLLLSDDVVGAFCSWIRRRKDQKQGPALVTALLKVFCRG